MQKEVKIYVLTCPTYQHIKPRKHVPYGLLAALPQPVRPFQEISMDFITGLPSTVSSATNRHYDAILVIVDRFTKYALYIPTQK